MTDAELARIQTTIAIANAAPRADALALLAEVLRLRAALLGASTVRQFGPCWCSTLAGLYCVAQPRCRAAREALSL